MQTAKNQSKTEPKTEAQPEVAAEAAAAPAETATPSQAHTESAATAEAAKTPFGAWAMPSFAHFAQLPLLRDLPGMDQLPQHLQNMPGMAQLQETMATLQKNPAVQAMQSATREQLTQVQKTFDEVAAQEAKAVEQFKAWVSEVHKLQNASIDYAVALQNEARKAAQAQLQQLAKAVGPAAKPAAETPAAGK